MAKESVLALDALLDRPFRVLDHGFVAVVDYMGSDSAIVKAARNSIGGEEGKKVQSDEGLLRYLMRKQHSSPFEFCEIKLHCKLPMFVARQWIRHRTANVSEVSGRYSELPQEFYVPDTSAIGYQAKHNRQGSGAAVPLELRDQFQKIMRDTAETTFRDYQTFLGKEHRNLQVARHEFEQLKVNGGIARETARINLPLSAYTTWYWKIDLKNLLHFLKLRKDPAAQTEIRAYADVIADIVRKWVPITWAAFEDFQLYATTLTRLDKDALRAVLDAHSRGVVLPLDQLLQPFPTEREKTEFRDKIQMLGLLKIFNAATSG